MLKLVFDIRIEPALILALLFAGHSGASSTPQLLHCSCSLSLCSDLPLSHQRTWSTSRYLCCTPANSIEIFSPLCKVVGNVPNDLLSLCVCVLTTKKHQEFVFFFFILSFLSDFTAGYTAAKIQRREEESRLAR